MHRCHRKNKIFRKIGLIASTSENDVLSSLIISSASLLFEERACAKVQKRNFISSASCGKFIDLFSKLRSNKKALRIFYTIGPLTEVNMVLFKRNKRFNVTLFLTDYNWGGYYQFRSAPAAKHIWVALITHWGLLHSPPGGAYLYCEELGRQ